MPVINKSDRALMRKVLCVLAAVLGICLLIGTVFDYQITDALYHAEQPIAQVLSAVGLLMLAIPLCIFLGALIQRNLEGSKPLVVKVLLCVVMVILGCYSSAEMMKSMLNYHGIGPLLPFEVSTTVSKLLGVLVGLINMVLGYRAAVSNNEPELMKRMVVVVLLLVGVFAVAEILKNVMHRPRYLTIILSDADVVFHPWHRRFSGANELIEALGVTSDAFKSFPSGHSVQMGAAAISFYGLAALFPSLRTKWSIVIVGFVVLLICVMASRLVLGAHYLSDVAVGAGLSVLAGLYLFSLDEQS